MKKVLAIGIIAVLLLFFTMPVSTTLVINGIVSDGEGIWTEVAGNATYNGGVDISGYYYGNGSQLTGVSGYTDVEAVAAADASNIFLERNVENTVTAGTTLKRTTCGRILNFKASVASLGVVIEPADLILESTTHIFNQMFIQATYPQIKAIDKDGVTKIIGYQKTAKAYGSKSTWMEYAVLNSAGALVPGFQINHDSVNLIGHQIRNVADPTGAQHAATKNYVDTNKYTDAEARASISDIFGADGKADADIDLDNHFIINPKRHNQSAEPTLNNGEMCIWRDTDDGKVYLIYKDETSGQKKVEMT